MLLPDEILQEWISESGLFDEREILDEREIIIRAWVNLKIKSPTLFFNY